MYNARDCGRIVRYARESGESDKAICREIHLEGGLECGDCDCERLKDTLKNTAEVTAIALATFAIIMATRGRVLSTLQIGMNCAKLENKTLNVLTKEEYQTLEKLYSKDIVRVDSNLQKVLNELSLAEREAFAQKQAGIIIRPPTE